LAVQVLDKGELPEYAIHSFSYRSQPDVIVQFRFDDVNAVEHPRMMSCVVAQNIQGFQPRFELRTGYAAGLGNPFAHDIGRHAVQV